MPEIKTLRDDIIRRPELDDMLKRARGKVTAALIAMLWLFGKRISEVIKLRKRDVWVEGGYLYARFTVGKKPKDTPLRDRIYVKRIKATHPYVKYIMPTLIDLGPDDRIFPIGRTKAWRLLKNVNPNVYPHFFRHSLATSMAERGASVIELMSWFDWDRTESAMKYVKRGIKLIEKWADREF